MSIRTAEPGSSAADEPERPTDVAGEGLASPAPLPGPAPVDAGVEPVPEPLDVEHPSDQGEGLRPAATDPEQGGSDVVTASGDVAVPEAPVGLVPVPAQDLSPAVPTAPAVPAVSAVPATSGAASRSSAIEAPSPLGAEHDAVVATGAGGAGSGTGSTSTAAGGKGRGRKPKKDPEGRMALREHLTELRKRVVRAGVFVLVGAIAGWFLYIPVIEYMTEPLRALEADASKQVQINFSNVASSFDLQLKGAVWIGVIISSPLWIYQLWAFITPGLTKKERRYAVGFVGAGAPLFLGGVFLASLFIPRAVAFFTSFTPDGGSNIIDAPIYISFVMRTVLTFGLSFLLPVVLVALNFAGLLSGAAVLKAWRWVLVASLTFAAVATPTPDVTAMFTLAAPIITLFALAIVICLLHDRRKAKRSPSYAGVGDDDASDLGDDEAAPL